MKSTLSGLVAALIIGAIGLILLRSTGVIKVPSLFGSPSPTASAEPKFQLAPIESASPAPSVSPEPSSSPVSSTKGGLVLGEEEPTPAPSTKPVTTTKTVTTTTTVTHATYTLAKVSNCPANITAELKDISKELSIQYRIRDNYSAAITVWNEKGEELAGQKLYTGNGQIVSTGSAKSIKVVIQPSGCSNSDDAWLTVFASR